MTKHTPKKLFSNAHSYHINTITLNSDCETFVSQLSYFIDCVLDKANLLFIKVFALIFHCFLLSFPWTICVLICGISTFLQNHTVLWISARYKDYVLLDVVDLKPAVMDDLVEVFIFILFVLRLINLLGHYFLRVSPHRLQHICVQSEQRYELILVVLLLNKKNIYTISNFYTF